MKIPLLFLGATFCLISSVSPSPVNNVSVEVSTSEVESLDTHATSQLNPSNGANQIGKSSINKKNKVKLPIALTIQDSTQSSTSTEPKDRANAQSLERAMHEVSETKNSTLNSTEARYSKLNTAGKEKSKFNNTADDRLKTNVKLDPASSTESVDTEKVEPKSAESKPKSAESKPKSAESKPKSAESKPKSAESKPKSAESKPMFTESKPKSSEGQPKSGADKPTYNRNKSKTEREKNTGIVKSKSEMEKLTSEVDEPKSEEAKSDSGVKKPTSAKDKTDYGTEKLTPGEGTSKSVKDKTKSGADKPKFVEDKPQSEEEKPKNENVESDTEEDKPKTGAEKPWNKTNKSASTSKSENKVLKSGETTDGKTKPSGPEEEELRNGDAKDDKPDPSVIDKSRPTPNPDFNVDVESNYANNTKPDSNSDKKEKPKSENIVGAKSVSSGTESDGRSTADGISDGITATKSKPIRLASKPSADELGKKERPNGADSTDDREDKDSVGKPNPPVLENPLPSIVRSDGKLVSQVKEDTLRSGSTRSNSAKKLPSAVRSQEDTGSNRFVVYFISAVFVFGSIYIIYHKKQKILAFIVEGRRGRGGCSRSRSDSHRASPSGGGGYKQLPADEQALLPPPGDKKPESVQNFIY